MVPLFRIPIGPEVRGRLPALIQVALDTAG